MGGMKDEIDINRIYAISLFYNGSNAFFSKYHFQPSFGYYKSS